MKMPTFHQMLALHDRLLIARYEQLNFDCNAPILVALCDDIGIAGEQESS